MTILRVPLCSNARVQGICCLLLFIVTTCSIGVIVLHISSMSTITTRLRVQTLPLHHNYNELASNNEAKNEWTFEAKNPLLKLKQTGQRVAFLPRNKIVATITGAVGSRWKHRPVEDNGSLDEDMMPFDYRTCPLENALCIVSHPLPESIFPPTVTFCIHNQSSYGSEQIRRYGVWEMQHLYLMWATFAQDPEIQFIDIGANIGLIAIVAAMMGRHVVAVEPIQPNLNILCQSIIENDLTERVVTVPFAVSDQRTTFEAKTVNNNWGETFLQKNSPKVFKDTQTVRAILTDDLLKFIIFRKAILKIDIEGHEPAVFRSAAKLFDKVYIPVVIMEWGKMRQSIKEGSSDPIGLLDFFYNRGYSAYRVGGMKLDRDNHLSWGQDIYWLHQNYTFEVDPWSVY